MKTLALPMQEREYRTQFLSLQSSVAVWRYINMF